MKDEDEAPRSARRRNSALGIGITIPLVLCLLCGGIGVFARGSMARYLARAELASHGISCGDGFDVTPDAGFTRAQIAPCTCTMQGGAVESFEIVTPMTVTLDGRRVTHVDAGTLRVAMRAASPSVDAGSLGPIASMLGVPARIGGIVNAASQVARMDAPALEVETLEVKQEGRVTVSIDILTLDGGHPLVIAAHHIDMPALTGPLGAHADVTIDALSGTASASDVSLSGDLALNGSAPIVGTVARSGHVVVTGTALDTDAPTYRVAL